MVVNNFYVIGTVARPDETDSPLIIHANAALVFPVSLKLFEAVAGRRSQIIKRRCRIEDHEFPQRGTLNVL